MIEPNYEIDNNQYTRHGISDDRWYVRVENHRARIAALEAENERLKADTETMRLLDRLRGREGMSVEIPHPNPEFDGPVQRITVYDITDEDWPIDGVDYHGASLNECLSTALAALAEEAIDE